MRKLFSALILLSLVKNAAAQVFGNFSPYVKWKQVNTDTVRVIFQQGQEDRARRVATLVHLLAAQTTNGAAAISLGKQFRKINIVLQNQTTVSNAYVSLGPYRSEFFLTPSPDNFDEGSLPWPELLATHEYRHVMQYNNFNNGLSKFMHTIFGDDGYTVAINASVPNWFFEGDAVYQETALTQQGRGRIPHFTNAYPSLWLAGKHYSWMKLRNGSLKDYVPDHYDLGYLLVNYGRQKYGPDFWTKVTQDATAYKGLFYPFQSAIKRYAGTSYQSFIKNAFDYYKNDRSKPGEQPALKVSNVFPVNKRYVTDYFFPYSAGADSLIYLKESYRHRPAFFLKTGNTVQRIRTRDISSDHQFSYRNGKIVYTAFESNARWGYEDYSDIRVLNVATHQQQKVTQHSKYFTPDISADGSKIVAVQNAADGSSALHILDATDGKVLQSIHSEEINLFTDPKFLDENTVITAVRLRNGQMALATADITSGSTERLTQPSFNVIGYLSVNNGIICYTSTYHGQDDVFALRLSDKKIFRLTNGPLGNYFVNVGYGKLTWSTFTAEGYQLQQADEKDLEWKETGEAGTGIDAGEKLTPSQPGGFGNVLDANNPVRNFTVTKYRKGTNILHLHSWRPYYDDPIIDYSIYGENILNTLQTEFYYQYNRDDKTNAVGFNAVFGQLFPYLNGGVQYIFDEQQIIGQRTRDWAQLDSYLGLSVPLHKVSGTTIKDFNIGSAYVYRNEMNKGFYKDSLGNTSFSYLHHTISFSSFVQQMPQHIYPKMGFSASFNLRHLITNFKGYQFIGDGALFVPGALPTHNLVLRGSFQQIDTFRRVLFGNLFPYSRGYTGRYFTRMWKLSANYDFPLLYPDWGFGNILYIKRIWLNGFYDFTKVYSRDKTQTRDQRSAGGEIFFDTKWWNQYELTFGFRVSQLLDYDQFDGTKGTIYEIVLPVSIIPH